VVPVVADNLQPGQRHPQSVPGAAGADGEDETLPHAGDRGGRMVEPQQLRHGSAALRLRGNHEAAAAGVGGF